MNKKRRADLEKATALIYEAFSLIENARDEEQEYYDNMPEGLQGSCKGEQAEAAVSCMDEVMEALDSASLEDAMG